MHVASLALSFNEDETESNAIKVKTLPLAISREELLSGMKGAPLASSRMTEDGEYEALYFQTPVRFSVDLAALIEIKSQKVVGFRIGEWEYRALDEHEASVRKEFALTSNESVRHV